MIVRDLRPGEARRFEQVRIDGWHAAYGGILHPDVLRDLVLDEERVAWREQWLADPHPGEVALVGEVDGSVVGAASLLPARDEDLDGSQAAELAMLYVAPEHWRCGVGAALLAEGFGRMPQPEQVLWVLEHNTPARRFYERHGFALDGGRKVLALQGDPVEVRYRRSAL